MADKKVRVLAPYVTLKVLDATGTPVVLGFHQGAVVDGEVEKDSLQHHLDDGMVELVSEKALYEPLGGPEGAMAPTLLEDEDSPVGDDASKKQAAAKKTASNS